MGLRTRETMPVGIVIERRRSRHAWQDYSWRVVSLIPGAPAAGEWRMLYAVDDRVSYHAATLPLELYASDTAGYRLNLSQRVPCVYIVSDRHADGRLMPVVATVNASEVTDYFDSSDKDVEGVPMPEEIARWIADYVARYHREMPFEKRQRKPHDPGRAAGGKDDAG